MAGSLLPGAGTTREKFRTSTAGRPQGHRLDATFGAIDEPHAGGTRMVTMTTFPSLEALEQLLEMGMEEGMKAATGQIDEVLAGGE